MPFPFRSRKDASGPDGSGSISDASIPTLPPIKRVASNKSDEDWLSGSDSGHGGSHAELSDPPRSQPPTSIRSGGSGHRRAKRVSIPESDTPQEGTVEVLEKELRAAKAQLAEATGRRDRKRLEKEVASLESELEEFHLAARNLENEITDFERRVSDLRAKEREQAPTSSIRRAFDKLRSADEASDEGRVQLQAIKKNPLTSIRDGILQTPDTRPARALVDTIQRLPPPEKNPLLAAYNVALEAACRPCYEHTGKQRYRNSKDPRTNWEVKERVQNLYKAWLETSRALAIAESKLYDAQARLARLQGTRAPVRVASPFVPAPRTSFPPRRSVLKVSGSEEVPAGRDPRAYLQEADDGDLPYEDSFAPMAGSRRLVR